MKKLYKFPIAFGLVNSATVLMLSIALLLPITLLAQTPSVRYSSGMHAYTMGVALTLSPTSTNVSPQGYSTRIDTIDTRSRTNYSFAVDRRGYIYYAATGGVYRMPPGGGTPVLIASGSEFSGPARGIALDTAGNIYVNYDTQVKRLPPGGGSIVKYVYSGTDNFILDLKDKIYFENSNTVSVSLIATASAYTFFTKPSAAFKSFVVDNDGDAYMINSADKKIIKILGKTTFSTLTTPVTNPSSLSLDPANNIYVIDNGTIKQMGIFRSKATTIVSGLSTGTSKAQSVTVDGKGILYIATSQNPGVNTNVYLQKVKPIGGYYINKALPAGMHFNSSTGVINGTPTTGSNAKNYTVYAYNASGAIDSTVVAIKVISNNADLSGLKTFDALPGLQPLFNRDTLNYTQETYGYGAYADRPEYYIQPTAADPNATITINNIGVASGERSRIYEIKPTGRFFEIVVKAADGVTKKIYTIAVRWPKSNDNLLKDIKLDDKSIGLRDRTYAYNTNWPYNKNFVMITPVLPAKATATVNGIAVTAASPAVKVNTPYGTTVATVVCTAENGTPRTYTINFYRQLSTVSYLSALSANVGTLSPGFTLAVQTYNDTVGYARSSIKVKFKTLEDSMSVKVNGVLVQNEEYSPYMHLDIGNNTINVTVTSQSGTNTRNYTIDVYRIPPAIKLAALQLSEPGLPTFSPSVNSYALQVGSGTGSVTFTPTASVPSALIKINGITVASGSAKTVALVTGTNKVNITVTSPDGIEKNVYTIQLTKITANNATLASLTLDTKSQLVRDTVTASLNTYTTSVSGGTTQVYITPVATDRNATVKVNSNAITWGTGVSVPLKPSGITAITTVVTSADHSTVRTYRVYVSKYGSANANLSSLKLNLNVPLTKVTSTTALNTYFAVVPANTGHFTLTAVTSDAGAALEVDYRTAISGQPRYFFIEDSPLRLDLVVTAEDGTTVKTYSVTVIKALPANTIAARNSRINDIGIALNSNNPTTHPELIVHQALSPNGDGLNDVLAIDGITAYPENQVSVMDKNGAVVFETKGYGSTSKTFDGHTTGGTKMQPGTYFYSVDYVDGSESKRKTGYIVIKY